MIIPRHLTKLSGNSLFLFTPTNQLRIYLFKLIKTDLFEYVVCFFVLLLTFLRLFDSPKYYENLLLSLVVWYVEILFTFLIVCEFIFTNIVYWMIFCGKDSYFRKKINILMFCVMCSSLLNLAIKNNQSDILNLLKILRVISILRILIKNYNFKVSLLSLLYSIPEIINFTLLSLLILWIFSIFFLNLLKGKFYKCIFEGES